MDGKLKPLDWIGSSKKDLMAMPEEVIDLFGYALHLAQEGRKHDVARPLQGFGSAGVLEVVTSQQGDAFRAVYTVRLMSSMSYIAFRRNRGKASVHRNQTWT